MKPSDQPALSPGGAGRSTLLFIQPTYNVSVTLFFLADASNSLETINVASVNSSYSKQISTKRQSPLESTLRELVRLLSW